MGNNPSSLPNAVSQAEYARQHGVSRKTVTQWKADGYLVLTPAKQVDVEKSDACLADRPDDYRGGVTKGPKAGNTSKQVTVQRVDEVTPARKLADLQGAAIRRTFGDDFSRGAAIMAHELVRQIGSLGAVATVANGGSCEVAFGVEHFLQIALMDACEDWMRSHRFGPFASDPQAEPDFWPEPEQCGKPNWPNLAKEAGEPFAPDAWAAAFQRRQRDAG